MAAGFVFACPCPVLLLAEHAIKMQNDDGETVDLYIPRKWCDPDCHYPLSVTTLSLSRQCNSSRRVNKQNDEVYSAKLARRQT